MGNLHQLTGAPFNDLLVAYGQYLFPKLMLIDPDMMSQFNSSFELVAAVDSIIHVEVKKLYPDAELPQFEVINRNKNELQVSYTSCRPFAYLANGLILGCAEHYNEDIAVEIEHAEAHCLISLSHSNGITSPC